MTGVPVVPPPSPDPYQGMFLPPTEYLRFELLSSTGKTTRWEVISQRGGNVLGEIKWYGPWRQYTFFPAYGTIFNVGCMNDIVDRIETLMRTRRNVRINQGLVVS